MNSLVPIALFGWPVVAMVFFALLRPRHAVLATIIGGWLFLPVAGYDLPGLPPYNKVIAAIVSALVGIAIFDTKALTSLRPKWIDLPVFIAAFASPMATSVTNGLGVYDGFSNAIDTGVQWFGAWIIGRAYFSTREGIRDAAMGFVIGSLVYVPLVLIEIRLSPQLNNWVYGFRFAHFQKSIRLGGYRPVVFMETGMMVATWLASGGLCALWLWRCKAKRAIMGMPIAAVAIGLIVITIMCRSAYAMLELAMVSMIMFSVKWTKMTIPFLLLVAFIPGYMLLRTTNSLDMQPMVQLAEDLVNKQRAQSLETRLIQEKYYSEHARDRIVFGWGGYDRFRPKNEDAGRALDGADALWTITIARNGLFGLIPVYLIFLLPMVAITRRVKGQGWGSVQTAHVTAVAGALLMFTIDTLLNGQYNPVYVAVAGGLACYQPERVGFKKMQRAGAVSKKKSGVSGILMQQGTRPVSPLSD